MYTHTHTYIYIHTHTHTYMCIYMYNNKDLEPFFKDLVAEMQEIDYQGELGAQFNIYWKTDLWDQEIRINSNSRVRASVVQEQLPWAGGSWLCVSKSMPSTLVTWLSHGGVNQGTDKCYKSYMCQICRHITVWERLLKEGVSAGPWRETDRSQDIFGGFLFNLLSFLS